MEKEQAITANIAIGRHVNGITLNPLEYLLDASDEVLLFGTEALAKEYLTEHGVEDFEGMEFVEMEEQKMDKQWYDVHFTMSGFVKVEAVDKKQAEAQFEDYMGERLQLLEKVALTGLGLEVGDILPEGAE